MPSWLHHEGLRLEVNAPGGQRWQLVCVRTGTGVPRRTVPWFVGFRDWPLPGPIAVVLNRLVFLGRWTVLVGGGEAYPWWTARRRDQVHAEQLARHLSELITSGRWNPEVESIETALLPRPGGTPPKASNELRDRARSDEIVPVKARRRPRKS